MLVLRMLVLLLLMLMPVRFFLQLALCVPRPFLHPLWRSAAALAAPVSGSETSLAGL